MKKCMFGGILCGVLIVSGLGFAGPDNEFFMPSRLSEILEAVSEETLYMQPPNENETEVEQTKFRRFAFQFTCDLDEETTRSGWMDERISNAVPFEGIDTLADGTCEVDHLWTKSCDAMCIEITDTYGGLKEDVDVNRIYLRVARGKTNSGTADITWDYTPYYTYHPDYGYLDTRVLTTGKVVPSKVTYCWDESWPSDFATPITYNHSVITKMVDVRYLASDNSGHIFRAVPYFPPRQNSTY